MIVIMSSLFFKGDRIEVNQFYFFKEKEKPGMLFSYRVRKMSRVRFKALEDLDWIE